jgi:hypothetical protein
MSCLSRWDVCTHEVSLSKGRLLVPFATRTKNPRWQGSFGGGLYLSGLNVISLTGVMFLREDLCDQLTILDHHYKTLFVCVKEI